MRVFRITILGMMILLLIALAIPVYSYTTTTGDVLTSVHTETYSYPAPYSSRSVFIHTTVKNHDQSKSLRNLHVRGYLPELGIMFEGDTFDVQKGNSASGYLVLDSTEIPPGEYVVRIVASNDDVRTVKHRIIVIE